MGSEETLLRPLSQLFCGVRRCVGDSWAFFVVVAGGVGNGGTSSVCDAPELVVVGCALHTSRGHAKDAAMPSIGV